MKKDLRFQTIIAFIFMKDNSTSEIVNSSIIRYVLLQILALQQPKLSRLRLYKRYK